MLKALGAEIVRVPTAPFGTPGNIVKLLQYVVKLCQCPFSDHYISIAHRLKRDIPNSYIFDQVDYPNLCFQLSNMFRSCFSIRIHGMQ